MIIIARIFIVDDDRTIVSLFEEFLKEEGHEVVGKAFNGEQAVTICQNMDDHPEIILMDIRMPKKDGVTAGKEILEIHPNCRIIFITADSKAKSLALSIGAAALLEKPFSFKELLTEINQAL
ncbi:MAG: response regulator [Candidatus Hodarchaeales archaeon]